MAVYFILCAVFTAAAAAAVFIKRKLAYFEGTSVKCISTRIYLRSLLKCILGTQSFNEHINTISHPFPDQKYVGSFEILAPVIVLRHPSAIKMVCVEQFDSFVNHKTVLDEDLDPLFGRMIFCMTDQKWRDMRAELTPAYSGSKLKNLFGMTYTCSKDALDFYKNECTKNEIITGDLTLELNAQEIALRYTISFLTHSVFGSTSDVKANEISGHTKRCIAFAGRGLLKFALLRYLPKFLRTKNIQISPPDLVKYYQQALYSAINWRSENKVYVPDFIQMMGEAKKDWTVYEQTAQLMMQSLAYVTTVPTQIANVLHELVCNPHILAKLRGEIDKVDEETNGEPTYADLNAMEYLDMVVSETMRKWPVAALTERVCTRNCSLGPASEDSNQSYVVQKGQVVIIPIYSIQNDPQYWNEPCIFDPERFSKENKRNIKPLTYIPFGAGPRNCLALRHGLLHIKIFLYQIILHFNMRPGKNMKKNLKLMPHTLVTSIKGGTWLEIEPRNKC